MKPALSTRAVNKIIAIAESKTEKYRTELNKNVHVADISYTALKGSVSTLEEIEYFVIQDAFNNSAAHSSRSLSNALRQVKNGEWKGLVYVSDSLYGNFLIAVSYDRLQQYSSKILKNLTTVYSNLSGLLGTDNTGKTTARIGHIASSFSNATTPLLQKLNEIYKRLPLKAGNKIASEIFNLKSSHTFDVEYAFDRLNVIDNLSSILGRGTVFVTIQSDAKNSSLSKIETEINRNVVQYLKSAEFAKDILVEPGSNSMLEDFAFMLKRALDPKLQKPAKHSKKSPTKKSTVVKDKSKVLPLGTTPIRDVKGKFFSLANLQLILNSQLQDVVSANMGDGSRRDILNYRSGRFAESVQVERLSQSRQGMITAFYTYMKNPYATFSQGGRQSSPSSRDPKLLIARSIREIASQHVTNAMRSVNV